MEEIKMKKEEEEEEKRYKMEYEEREERREQVFLEWRRANAKDLVDEFLDNYSDEWEMFLKEAFNDEVDEYGK